MFAAGIPDASTVAATERWPWDANHAANIPIATLFIFIDILRFSRCFGPSYVVRPKLRRSGTNGLTLFTDVTGAYPKWLSGRLPALGIGGTSSLHASGTGLADRPSGPGGSANRDTCTSGSAIGDTRPGGSANGDTRAGGSTDYDTCTSSSANGDTPAGDSANRYTGASGFAGRDTGMGRSPSFDTRSAGFARCGTFTPLSAGDAQGKQCEHQCEQNARSGHLFVL